MKPSRSHAAAVCLFGLVYLSLGAHVPLSKLMEVVEDVDDGPQASLHNEQPQYTLFLDEDELGMEQEYHGIQKRGYYTCYNRQTNSITVPDCQAIIDRIETADQPSFTVPSGLCLTWWQGTCMSRLCAKSGAPLRGLNKTSGSVVGELRDVILNDCVRTGLEGMAGDCANMDANCGSYRLTLEHHGSEVLGGPPPNPNQPAPVSMLL
ncbi:hypothetical protein PFICI_07880 [Pestalotiopsis fici W106-1]|uniref:Ecp2 effector protein domain-containing protein n=1 Tax=Pestalotiopsis fici (strain W106-1 / CGMCC3.15140) TaxID=1229662 RepID=W3X591_PESFW|nr:uncharacterized protein PFICI_07880 [Pestalotiopsis fici W106-1]ETS80351.1 hypothetical protein PFICI_07880 [Pestalotiopsis fici W106-1]